MADAREAAARGERILRVLVLHPESFGGRGGIAKHNRDLLTALASHPATALVTALPRYIAEPVGELPARIEFRREAANNKADFLLAELALLARAPWYDLVICAHLRLLPLTLPLRWRRAAPLGLVIHGIEAWEPSGGASTRGALARLDWFLAVSEATRTRFLAWSGLPPERGFVIHNAVDTGRFTPGPKRPDLLARHGLAGRTVLMSLARLDKRERYKGIDQVLEAMPALLERHPDLAYLVGGEGDDRPRLEAKARALGLAERVVFTGYLPEADKADYLRLADCFLLAGWGEGFGYVLLEAMACGVPAVASSLDGSREAVGNGALGVVVDPRDQADLIRGIEEALDRPRGAVPAGLARFSYQSFEAQVHRTLLDPLVAKRGG